MEVVGISTVTAIEGAASGIDPAEVVAVAERTASRCGPSCASSSPAAYDGRGQAPGRLADERVVEQVGEGELGGTERAESTPSWGAELDGVPGVEA
jgi:hypothetical protein